MFDEVRGLGKGVTSTDMAIMQGTAGTKRRKEAEDDEDDLDDQPQGTRKRPRDVTAKRVQ